MLDRLKETEKLNGRKNRDAQFLRLLQLAAGLIPADKATGLLRHTIARNAAFGTNECVNFTVEELRAQYDTISARRMKTK